MTGNELLHVIDESGMTKTLFAQSIGVSRQALYKSIKKGDDQISKQAYMKLKDFVIQSSHDELRDCAERMNQIMNKLYALTMGKENSRPGSKEVC